MTLQLVHVYKTLYDQINKPKQNNIIVTVIKLSSLQAQSAKLI